MFVKVGGRLVSIHSSAENAFISTLLASPDPDMYTFIGADCVKDGDCTWTDGTPWDYQNWAEGFLIKKYEEYFE